MDIVAILQDDGTSIPFNLGKLIISIASSFQHDTKEGAYASYYLAKTIHHQLATRPNPLSAADIAITTHSVLQKFDPTAALQYAIRHQLLTNRRRAGRPSTVYSSGISP